MNLNIANGAVLLLTVARSVVYRGAAVVLVRAEQDFGGMKWNTSYTIC